MMNVILFFVRFSYGLIFVFFTIFLQNKYMIHSKTEINFKEDFSRHSLDRVLSVIIIL